MTRSFGCELGFCLISNSDASDSPLASTPALSGGVLQKKRDFEQSILN